MREIDVNFKIIDLWLHICGKKYSTKLTIKSFLQEESSWTCRHPNSIRIPDEEWTCCLRTALPTIARTVNHIFCANLNVEASLQQLLSVLEYSVAALLTSVSQSFLTIHTFVFSTVRAPVPTVYKTSEVYPISEIFFLNDNIQSVCMLGQAILYETITLCYI